MCFCFTKLRFKRNVFCLIISILICGFLYSETAETYVPRDREEVNSFDRLLMNPYSKGLDYTGTAFEAATCLSPLVMFSAPPADYWKIGLEYVETMALAFGVKELCKLLVERPRPYMYFDGAPEIKIQNGDCNDSFVSGHSTLAFAATTFTTFMFCSYFPESEYKIPVIIGSYSLALVTAGLRIASGNHFMTDVICGAVIGSAVGFLVPWINSFWIKTSTSSYSNSVLMNISPSVFSVKVKF